MTFNELKIIDPILAALKEEGYTKPTPIQEQAIPILLKGTDLLGCAQTGTGKTAAFSIPILQLLQNKKTEQAGRPEAERNSFQGRRKIKVLILTPTRELASQIGDSIKTYGKKLNFIHTVIFGGVNQNPQVNMLRSGVDILVATPGRLLDLMNQKHIHLDGVEFFVLDEADRMLDMGFIHDIKKILPKLPAKRQSLFFSATMPKSIAELANSILTKPETVKVSPVSSTADTIQQEIYHVLKSKKQGLLKHLIETKKMNSVLVFSRTKHGADRITKDLARVKIESAAIHGNKSQNNREKALAAFKARKIKVLVATDIAARGIDIDDLQYVINFDLPNEPEAYVHRIGRTGRAGASGKAMSFCDIDERPYLKDIEKLIRKELPVISDHPFVISKEEEHSHVPSQIQKQRPQRSNRSNNSHQRSDSGKSGHGGKKPGFKRR
jgi:ATP-dependent RNA helicase RhlE